MLRRLREIINLGAKSNGTPDPAPPVSLPQPEAKPSVLGDFAVDDYPPMKIIAIGAGMSGILAGIRYVCTRHLVVFGSPDGRTGSVSMSRILILRYTRKRNKWVGRGG